MDVLSFFVMLFISSIRLLGVLDVSSFGRVLVDPPPPHQSIRKVGLAVRLAIYTICKKLFVLEDHMERSVR